MWHLDSWPGVEGDLSTRNLWVFFIPLASTGTIVVSKLSSVTAFFTLKVKMKCMMVFYSLNYAMHCF